MNKVTFYFILSITTLLLSSCSKNDTSIVAEPARVYSEQYVTDIALIKDYLTANYITVNNNPGFPNDQDVTITKIPVGGNQPSIMSYLDAVTFPKLLIHHVKLHDVDYEMYYLVLRPGTGASPCNVDGVLASYRGDYLYRSVATTTTNSELTATKFDESIYPQSYLSLLTTITGWSEIFPQFKTGTFSSNPDGTTTYNNFGAGVMFIPSGLAYYNSGSGLIPGYSPLVFSFKLYDIQRLDQDNDGVPSYLEDINGDGYVRSYVNTISYPTTPTDAIRYADDTDKDGIPDFVDVDDDGDLYSTILELKNTTTGSQYPFALIPDCSGNTTNPTRIKKYLDKNCH
ncbi:FKBP-type peptidyl-prolyl cis-trans isomerase [Flavobacterium cellulosilyticum]|uniref:FKBP-type peptidylprolyl isomerase n=1 Tax=Flavobacterium cellulosilyticum TaxID=2541731 RepID=A0A4R5CD26_9FLAO|nr:FKBP-type peptidylprolyl isomerase [Flavobacterium cellulosilyticum]TDD97375.1 FKBP-type peptidylprolyl isomerase [Flavobacterium cellulosilyticum]